MKNFILTLCAIIPLGVFAQIQSPDASQIESDENVRLEKIDQKETVKETKKEKKAREKKMRELNEDIAYAKAPTQCVVAILFSLPIVLIWVADSRV